MFAFAFLAASGTLTLRQVVTDIPHDLAALVVYLMFAAFIGLTWLGSRASVVSHYATGAAAEEPDAAGAPEVPAAGEPEMEPAAARRAARRGSRRARSAERIAWVG
jgi:hypothetical protein